MTFDHCPPIEALFDPSNEGHARAQAHAKDCAACSALLEEHRQLEKDLYRLADPLPPPDFVQSVMRKVAAAPRPVSQEVRMALFIFVAALVLGTFTLLQSGHGPAAVSAGAASFLIDVQSFALAFFGALITVWRAARLEVALASFALLFTALFGLRRLAGAQPAHARG